MQTLDIQTLLGQAALEDDIAQYAIAVQELIQVEVDLAAIATQRLKQFVSALLERLLVTCCIRWGVVSVGAEQAHQAPTIEVEPVALHANGQLWRIAFIKSERAGEMAFAGFQVNVLQRPARPVTFQPSAEIEGRDVDGWVVERHQFG